MDLCKCIDIYTNKRISLVWWQFLIKRESSTIFIIGLFAGSNIVYWNGIVNSSYVIKSSFIKVILFREVIADRKKFIPIKRFCWRKWQRIGEFSNFQRFDFFGKAKVFLFFFTADQ